MIARRPLMIFFAGLAFTGLHAGAENHCGPSGPSPVWIVDSSYPFQAGSEATFDEFYHGPWKAEADITLYQHPGSNRVVGQVLKGTIVDALVAESRVIHPLRLTRAIDSMGSVSLGFE